MDIGPLVIQTPSSGEMRVGWLSTKLCSDMGTLAADFTEPTEFVVQILARLIQEPSTTVDDIRTWTRADIEFIAVEWAKQPLTLQKDLAGSDDILRSFMDQVILRCAEFRKRTEKQIKSYQPPAHFLRAMQEATRLQRYFREVSGYPGVQRLLEEQERIRRAMEPHREAMALHREIQRQAQLLSGAVRNFHNMASEAFAAFAQQRRLYTNIFSALPDPADLVNRVKGVEDGIETLEASGYGFTAHVWDIPFIAELGRLTPSIRGAVATNRLTAFTRDPEFRGELQASIEATPVFRRRWAIINAAIDAHCTKNYVLAIPTLLAQLEGCITDMLILRGEAALYRGKLYARGSDGKVKKGRDNKPVQLRGLDSKLTNSRWKDEDVLEAISGLITESLTGERNGILHGRSVRYGKPKLSTQCILLIWILSREIREKLSHTK